MAFAAKILADSISRIGHRIVTFQLTYPRIIHAEALTHREPSRNGASSRAIPIEKMIAAVEDDPYIPTHWGKNQSGMQAEREMTAEEIELEREKWLEERDYAVQRARERSERGLHKQLANRPLETYHWYTAIFTATQWSNFFHLRNNADAHPEIQRIAQMAEELYKTSSPKLLTEREWHLPLVFPEDWELAKEQGVSGLPQTWALLAKVSCARCARVSYLTHEGKRDLGEDIALAGRLLRAGHMSPFEHAARPMSGVELEHFRQPAVVGAGALAPLTFDHNRPTYRLGNLNGWVQYRKTIPGEEDILAYRAAQQRELIHW